MATQVAVPVDQARSALPSTGQPQQSTLTADLSPYEVSVSGGSVAVSNNVSGDNERELLYSDGQPAVQDSSYCSRWLSGSGSAQNGVAFHISNHGRDAVVLERNIFNKGYWGFRVVYFHNGTIETGPGVDLSGYLGKGSEDVYPLNFCATLIGTQLSFAVGEGSTPAILGASGRSATLTVRVAPAANSASTGWTGTYAAHVPLGTTAVVDQIVIDGRHCRAGGC